MSTTTLTLSQGNLLSRRTAFDWVLALLVAAGAAYAFPRYGTSMDVYAHWILAGSVPALVALGWYWGPIRGLSLGVGAAVLLVRHRQDTGRLRPALALSVAAVQVHGLGMAAGFWQVARLH